MTKLKQLYYPVPSDEMWNQEVSVLLPWLRGKGVDVGCSNRSIFRTDLRVDINKEMEPDVLASADELPLKDGKFDYLYAIHVLEHMDDTKKALLEWARVVKVGGVVAIIHPDVEYTGIQRPQGLNPDENPFNEHKHERTYRGFLDWFKGAGITNLEMIADGEAMTRWSFYAVFVKK